jgi:membrane fusion protein, multidrug efflux system
MMWIFVILFVSVISLVYKVFKIKPQPWNIAIFVMIFFAAVTGMITLWTHASPYSTRAVVGRYVVPIVPWVQGPIVSISAKPNIPIKKGDVLFEIDPTSYQYTVNQAQAALQVARSDEARFAAGVKVAEANIAKVEADTRAAKSTLEITESAGASAISKQELIDARERYAAAEATLKQIEASRDQAVAAYAGSKDAITLTEEKLKTAQFSLTQCTVYAPANGFVTNWNIREGTFVVPSPSAAVGTFIDTSELSIVAPFKQQMLVNVKPGQEVELVFKSHPGRLFHGKVDSILEATGEGQGAVSGTLPSASKIGSPGILAVKILLNEDESADGLDLGTAGSLAIYTDTLKPVHIMSRVTMRMNKWLYFLPFM